VAPHRPDPIYAAGFSPLSTNWEGQDGRNPGTKGWDTRLLTQPNALAFIINVRATSNPTHGHDTFPVSAEAATKGAEGDS
jgi:hypothetical protein